MLREGLFDPRGGALVFAQKQEVTAGAGSNRPKAPASWTHSIRFASSDARPCFAKRLECAELAPALVEVEGSERRETGLSYGRVDAKMPPQFGLIRR